MSSGTIFLSHAHADDQLASRFSTLLRIALLGHYKVFQSSDQRGVSFGDDVKDRVLRELNTSDQVICLLTPNSRTRPWVMFEAGYTTGRHAHNVTPVLVGLNRNELPGPLAQILSCRAEDRDDLQRLLTQMLGHINDEILTTPIRKLISEEVEKFLEDLPSFSRWTDGASTSVTPSLDGGMRLLSALEVTQHLRERFDDPNVQNIIIVAYTNEVDGPALNFYTASTNKTVEVFKRSLSADLFEEQSYNTKSLAAGGTGNGWRKLPLSLSASTELSERFRQANNRGKRLTLRQFCYRWPPSRRAFIFDWKSAIVSHYQYLPDCADGMGSAYVSMGSQSRLLVTSDSVLGRFFLEELEQLVRLLRDTAIPLEEELAALKDGTFRHLPARERPCINPAAVLLDLDGVLYDSMPAYANAWRTAFDRVGIGLDDRDVYLDEGGSPTEFVRTTFRRVARRDPTLEQQALVLETKQRIVNEAPTPHLMDGATPLVRAISSSGLRMFVVTGSTRSGIAEQVEQDFEGLISRDNVVTASQYQRAKPDPEPFATAIRSAGIPPNRAVAIENAPLGVRSASAAGAFCIAVNTGPLDNEVLSREGARAVFASCTALASKWTELMDVLYHKIEA